jgi:hypothetical protein
MKTKYLLWRSTPADESSIIITVNILSPVPGDNITVWLQNNQLWHCGDFKFLSEFMTKGLIRELHTEPRHRLPEPVMRVNILVVVYVNDFKF